MGSTERIRRVTNVTQTFKVIHIFLPIARLKNAHILLMEYEYLHKSFEVISLTYTLLANAAWGLEWLVKRQ